MSIRSLGCFGFDEIGLVSPKKSWPNETGIRASKHFELTAKKVKTFNSIPEANHFFSKNEEALVKSLNKYIKKETALY